MGPEAKDPASQLAAPRAPGFLDLPPDARQRVYKRVLKVGHPMLSFPRLWASGTNICARCSEAKAVLYAENYFYLMDKPQQQDALLRSFLNCIGSPNANLLSRLCISFPVVEKKHGHPEAVMIRGDGLQSLSLLRGECTNLSTLELQLSNENSGFLAEAGQNDSAFVREALLRIAAQLDDIPSVDKVVVRLFVKDLSPLTVNMMQGFGWEVLSG